MLNRKWQVLRWHGALCAVPSIVLVTCATIRQTRGSMTSSFTRLAGLFPAWALVLAQNYLILSSQRRFCSHCDGYDTLAVFSFILALLHGGQHFIMKSILRFRDQPELVTKSVTRVLPCGPEELAILTHSRLLTQSQLMLLPSKRPATRVRTISSTKW